MDRFVKPLIWLSILLIIKTSVFLLLAAAGTTGVPSTILLGLAATWIALALLIQWVARRLNQWVRTSDPQETVSARPDLAR